MVKQLRKTRDRGEDSEQGLGEADGDIRAKDSD